MERLTNKDGSFKGISNGNVPYFVSKVEDIMEKYDIEDLSTLDKVVCFGKLWKDSLDLFPKWEAVDMVEVDKLAKDKGEK